MIGRWNEIRFGLMAQDVYTTAEKKGKISINFQTASRTNNITPKTALKRSNELMISGGMTKIASNSTLLSVKYRQRREPALQLNCNCAGIRESIDPLNQNWKRMRPVFLHR